jgi:hypothetical protein
MTWLEIDRIVFCWSKRATPLQGFRDHPSHVACQRFRIIAVHAKNACADAKMLKIAPESPKIL